MVSNSFILTKRLFLHCVEKITKPFPLKFSFLQWILKEKLKCFMKRKRDIYVVQYRKKTVHKTVNSFYDITRRIYNLLRRRELFHMMLIKSVFIMPQNIISKDRRNYPLYIA